MPKFGQTVEEGSIQRWFKKEGDTVRDGEALFEIETDKAVLEVPSFCDGTLLKILVPEGESAPVLTAVGYVGDPGDSIPDGGVQSAIPKVSATENSISEIHETQQIQGEVSQLKAAQPSEIRLKISPRASRLARENAIDPTCLQGTGPGGRVVEKDVKAYLKARASEEIRITEAAERLATKEGIDVAMVEGGGTGGLIRLADVRLAVAGKPRVMSEMRQTISRKMTESFTTTPHFYVTVTVDMTELLLLCSNLKGEGQSCKINDFLLKAVAMTLVEFPTLNSTCDGRMVKWNSEVNLGLAVALKEGVVVPVIRNADKLTLNDLHRQVVDLTTRARSRRLGINDFNGSTFTVSNMGMLDVDNFTAIINPGESAILAVSSVRKQPIVKDDQVVVRSMMKMTISADHRIVDGAVAAQFANGIKNKLENVSSHKTWVSKIY